MGITLCREEEEIAKANHPNLRLLIVPHRIAYAPEETFAGSWKPYSPETITQDGWGEFSAAAYFFGKELQKELNVPIGLIHSSWGGKMIEAWTAGAALNIFPEVQAELKEVNAIASSTSANPMNEIMDAWFLKNDPGSAKHWEKETTDTSTWRKVTLPNNYAACGIPGYEGVVWAKREIDIPVQWHEKPLVIQLGIISDTNTSCLQRAVRRRSRRSDPSIPGEVEGVDAKPCVWRGDHTHNPAGPWWCAGPLALYLVYVLVNLEQTSSQ